GDDGGGGAPDAAPGPLEDVHLIGRFEPAGGGGSRFAWPGSTIAARLHGPTIGIDLAGSPNQFDVTIDGDTQVLITSGGTDHYVLASGLADADHDVVVARRTEGFYGATTFAGFTDATPVATPAPTRLVELVGDSITCGYGVLGDSATCPFSADTEAETHAWGALAAAELGVGHVAVAYSGKGVYRNYGDDGTATMTALYLRTIPDDDASAWSFTDAPDVVVINLGTNDFSVGDPGAPFVAAMTTLIEEIRQRRADAWIVLALSPMLGDGYPAGEMHRTRARGYLQQAVADAHDRGDDRVDFLDLAEQDPVDGYGCDYHPSEVTQGKMATALAAKIRALTGW
ncbi:MAG: endo-1,4-beta-glucanase, partial [Myxococcales bacterium]|nr:endo-1,4-beta-glucanase [Myxococcales bacterium]